ncbi:MAG TPA: hypothetical protein VIA62_11775 [Thermoanaerobaculia bacterium]|nr:hypothetical protein [Thermoanaerobaculia bacterium]
MIRRQSDRRRKLAFLLIGCLVLGASGAVPPPGEAQAPYINITSTPPSDVPANASPEDLAKFAWQQLLALSWKAGYPGTGQRGLPDPTWSYSTPGAFPTLMTWQTYAQTTELRPNFPLTTPWAQLGIPKYSYQVPIAKDPKNPNAKNNLWNNLDEDNEIGSCDTYGRYKAQPNPKQLVLYQVKVNKDEYEYLRVNYGATQNSSSGKLGQAQTAVTKSITSSPYVYYSPGFPGNCGPCDPAKAICLPCGGAPNPAGGTYTGSIEVKSAWRMLQPGDDRNRFFTTDALYYDLDQNGKLVYKNGTFALIGIHIIHKTRNYPDFIFTTFEQVDVEKADMEYVLLSPPPPPPTPPNGTQVPPFTVIQRQTGQTNRTQLHPVPRTLDTVTVKVHQQLTKLNPSTIWQYYRLTGVQGHPVNCQPNQVPPANKNAPQTCVSNQNPVQCTNLDPNYFMANFVIESDPFLNNFSGPGFGGNPFQNCNNIVTFSTQSGRTQGTQLDMGGCKGCHGVAQTALGTDFSFLLDFGNNKPSIQPATVIYYPPSNPKPALKKYLKGPERSLLPLPKK